jgi:peptidoglycan/LPS O-acetylase OafA/YrhL
MSILGLSSSLAMKYWNRPNKIDRNLAANSYDIYLTHYIFVFLFQLLLFAIPGIPVLIKFIIVSVSSIICAYLAGQFLSRPYPKTTAALLFAMLFAMFVFVKP